MRTNYNTHSVKNYGGSKNNIQGAVFDMDGTLLDSMSVWHNLASDYLRSLGIDPLPDAEKHFKNMSLEQSSRHFKEKYGVTLNSEEIKRGIDSHLFDFYSTKAPLKNGAGKLLEYLKNHGIKMCLATATPRTLTEAALKRCGIMTYFEAVFTCPEIGHGKDEPHIFNTAAKTLGANKEDTLIFEDSLYAVKTAKREGFTVAAVYDEYEHENWDALKKTADYHFYDLSAFDLI